MFIRCPAVPFIVSSHIAVTAARPKDHPGLFPTKVLRGWGCSRGGAESGLLAKANERASQGIPRSANPDKSDSRDLKGHILSLRGCGAKEKEQGTGAEATESQSWCPAVSPKDTLLGDCRSLMNHQAGSNSSYSCSCCYEIIAKNNVIELSPFFFLGFYTFQVIINFSWFCIWYQIKVQFPCSVCGCLAFLALSTEDNPSLISHLSLLRTGWVHVVWVPYSIPSCLSFCFHAILFQS